MTALERLKAATEGEPLGETERIGFDVLSMTFVEARGMTRLSRFTAEELEIAASVMVHLNILDHLGLEHPEASMVRWIVDCAKTLEEDESA